MELRLFPTRLLTYSGALRVRAIDCSSYARLDPWPMDVPLKPLRRSSLEGPQGAPLFVLLPHEYFAAVFAASGSAWEQVMLGPGGAAGLAT